MTTQLSQTTSKAREDARQHAGGRSPADVQCDRLQVLVGELLSENQKLRFENDGLRARFVELENQAQSAENGLAEATKWAGMVF